MWLVRALGWTLALAVMQEAEGEEGEEGGKEGGRKGRKLSVRKERLERRGGKRRVQYSCERETESCPRTNLILSSSFPAPLC